MINITKKLCSVLLIASMLPIVNVFAESDIKAITFEATPTNSVASGLTADGSENVRVVEDGKDNKAFFIPTAYVGTTLETSLPGGNRNVPFAMRFDIKYKEKPSAVDVSIKDTSNTSVNILAIDDTGKVTTHDKKRIGSIGCGKYHSIVVVPDMNRGCYTVYLNGKCIVSDWALSAISDKEFAGLKIAFSETNVDGSAVYIDNIAVSGLAKCIREFPKETYNNEVYEFSEVDEKSKLTEIFYNEKFEDASSYTVALVPKENKAEVTNVNGRGVARVTKLADNADMIVQNLMRRSVKNMVLSVDLCYEDIPVDGILFYLRDTKSTTSNINVTPISVDTSGTLKVGGISSVKMKKGEWYTLTMLMNLKEHKYNFYVNGSLVTDKGGLPSNFGYLSEWRLYFGVAAQKGSWLIDNVQVYGGNEIRDISNEVIEEKSRYTDEIPTLLRGMNALQMYSNTVFKGNSKAKAEAECKIIGENVLIPEAVVEKVFGIEVSQNGGKIKIGSKTIYDSAANKTILDGKEILLSYQPITENGTVYIPAELLSKYQVSDKYFFDDNHGLLMQSDNEIIIEATDPRLSEANRYLFFDRVKPEELKAMFTAKNGTGEEAHPRLYAREDDFTALKEEVKTNALKKEWHDMAMAQADKVLGMEVPVYKIKDGRLLDVSNDFEDRIDYLAYAYKMTGDEKYGECIWKNIEAVCNFPDWHPDHTLDIAGMCHGVALGFDWAYDYFTDEQREFIMESSKKLGLDVARANYYGRATYSSIFWAETTTNWGIWINSPVSALAIATAENDIDYNMDVLYNALRSSEFAWYEIAPNGAWHEGASYWGTVTNFLTLLLSNYKTAFGVPYCGESFKGIEDLGLFSVYMSAPDGVINNLHDAYEIKNSAEGQTYIASLFKNSTMMQSRLSAIKRDNIIPDPKEILWCDTTLLTGDTDIDHVKYYGGTEMVTMMGDPKDLNTAWLSFHGGSTSGAHNHVDEGTFVYNIGGLRWFSDLGTEPLSYVSDADNPAIKAGYDSKFFYRRKTEGHNSIVINPDAELEMDINAFARVQKPVSTDNGVYSSIDLSDHYAKNASSYIRGYKLSEGMRAFTLRDEISLKKDNSELYWFLHTKGNIRIIDNNTAIIYYGGKQMKVDLITNVPDYELKVMEAKKLPTSVQFDETPNDAFSKLTVYMKASGKVNITARMTLVGEPASQIGVEDIPISQWDAQSTPAEKTEVSDVRLTGIKLNGIQIYGFDSEKFNYSYMLDESNKIPLIEPESDSPYEIEYYTDHMGQENALIKVLDDNGMYTSYVITFKPYTQELIGDYERCYVAGAQASSVPEDYNRPEHSFDGNYNTRWSGQGDGEWLVHDFGSVQKFNAIGVALWMGSQRVFRYDVLISMDGVNYTPILMNVSSSGTTEGLEIKELPQTVEARYIKYLGHGNSVNTWNNVIEFAALKKR